MTAGRKQDAVLRVLRGEPLEIVARELAVTAADVSGWREAFLDAGAASLKSRARDERDETIARLRTKVGELTMDAELLQAKIERLEAGAHPMAAGCHGGPGVVAVPLLRRGGRGPPHAAGCVGTPEVMSTVISISPKYRAGAPPLRCRPGLPHLGHCPGGGLPPPLCNGSAVRATAQAGLAGADARHGAGRDDPAGARGQPLPR